MKGLVVLCLMGLVIAGATGGCIGGKKEVILEQTDGENNTSNSTVLSVIYHDEQSGTVDTATYLSGARGEFTFPITSSSKKISIVFKAAGTPGAMGCGMWVLNSEGEEVANVFSNGDEEVKVEFKESAVKKGGVGDWTVYFVPQLPDVMATYSAVVDVYGVV